MTMTANMMEMKVLMNEIEADLIVTSTMFNTNAVTAEMTAKIIPKSDLNNEFSTFKCF